MQGQIPQQERIYANTGDAFVKILKNEGITGLQKGLVPAMLRESSKNIFRLGLFEPIMTRVHDKNNGPAPVWKRFFVGMFTGTLGAISCNPFELVKTRMQASANKAIAVGSQHQYKSAFSAVVTIARTEGVMSLWKGSGMSVVRSMLATSTNLALYTYTREQVLSRGIMKDGSITDAACSMFSSFFSTIFSNPIDVLRTRYYNQKKGGDGSVMYKSGIDALFKVVKHEGVKALGKGFFASFIRMGPHFTLTFVFYEQLKRIAIKWNNN